MLNRSNNDNLSKNESSNQNVNRKPILTNDKYEDDLRQLQGKN